MHLLQLFVTALMLFVYTIAVSKHGEKRVNDNNQKATINGMFWTFMFIHALYFSGDFYTHFSYPQAILLTWDAVCMGYAGVRKTTGTYNRYYSLTDALVTFVCLIAGGFYTNGRPIGF